MDVCTFLSHIQDPKVVVGFVVNIYDAINLDIDLFLTEYQEKQHKDAIITNYEYKDYNSRTFEDQNLQTPPGLILPPTQKGKAYRCRLKGIRQKSSSSNTFSYSEVNILNSRAKKDMTQIINRTNGWVLCTISKMDNYHRLLVDVLDPGLYPKYHFSYIQILLYKYPLIYGKYNNHHKTKGSDILTKQDTPMISS